MCRLCDVRTMRGLFSFDISLILLRFYFSLRAVCFSRFVNVIFKTGISFSFYFFCIFIFYFFGGYIMKHRMI